MYLHMYECWSADKNWHKSVWDFVRTIMGEYQTLAKSDQDIKNLCIRMEWVKNMFEAPTQIWLNIQLKP